MKYHVELTRSENKTTTIEAENPSNAIKFAEQYNPGFTAEFTSEIEADGTGGEVFVPLAKCEACERVIFVGEECDGDGEVYECAECMDRE